METMMNDDCNSNDWQSGWHAGMAAAADECRRIARHGRLDNEDQRIGALEAALAILQLKRSAEDARP
jgi:hypothetical protein